MNLAVRRRLSDLRTVLLRQIHRQKKRQVQKNRDEVRKNVETAMSSAYKCKICSKTRKKPCKMQGLWS